MLSILLLNERQHTSSPNVGDGPQLMVLSSAAMIILLFLKGPEKTLDLQALQKIH